MQKKKTILLIDDERGFVEALKFQIEAKKGFEVIVAYNGSEALEQLNRIEPDLIILDINMPEMGGVEFYKNICDSSARPRYPVVILTARANLEEVFKDLHVDGFISKPFELDDLLSRIDTVIAKKSEQTIMEKPELLKKSYKVLIVEDSRNILDNLALAFLNAGYTVSSAPNGTVAFDRLMTDIPDLILIKLDLSDLPGDLIAAKLKQISKTSQSAILLYTSEKRDELTNYSATAQICERIGIRPLIKSSEAYVLLKEAELVLRKGV